MANWRITSLSTTPALIDMADTDRKALAIAAGEAITDVAATIAVYAEPDTELDNLIESTEINDANDGAVVLISGLTRGALYEVSVIFTRSDGTTWTRTLAIRCVA